jgi:hypothetical protein
LDGHHNVDDNESWEARAFLSPTAA